jgi:hypothetical protein
MPNKPVSPPDVTRASISMKLLAAGEATLSNLRTTPSCCTTNQREPSPGACTIATGDAKLKLANTRSRLIESLLVGRSQARHDVLLGRVSSPSTEDPDDDEPAELDELDAEDVLLEVVDEDAEPPAPLLDPPPQAPTRPNRASTMVPDTAGRTRRVVCMVTPLYSETLQAAQPSFDCAAINSLPEQRATWRPPPTGFQQSGNTRPRIGARFSRLRTDYWEYNGRAAPSVLFPPGDSPR